MTSDGCASQIDTMIHEVINLFLRRAYAGDAGNRAPTISEKRLLICEDESVASTARRDHKSCFDEERSRLLRVAARRAT